MLLCARGLTIRNSLQSLLPYHISDVVGRWSIIAGGWPESFFWWQKVKSPAKSSLTCDWLTWTLSDLTKICFYILGFWRIPSGDELQGNAVWIHLPTMLEQSEESRRNQLNNPSCPPQSSSRRFTKEVLQRNYQEDDAQSDAAKTNISFSRIAQ